MQRAEVIGAEDVARAAAEVREHGGPDTVAAFAFDILSRQAEGKALFAGKKHVETRAEEHGMSRDDADTGRGNLLEILERGPESAAEYALVGAFAVRGLGARLKAGDEPGVLTSFVRHADWLEVATPYAVYAFVNRVLDDDEAARVYAAVADACVGARPGVADHGARGAGAVRVAALGAADSEAAADALTRVAEHAADPALRAAASFALGRSQADGAERATSDAPGRPVQILGRLGRPRRGALREALRIASGWALLSWFVRLLASLVGTERAVEGALVPGGIELRSRVTLLGRVIREREEVVPLTGLARLSRDVRYPTLHLLVGLSTLSVGVLVGGALAADAARSGATWVLLLGALVILVGAGLDLALDVFVPARRRKVAIDLAPAAGRAYRIEGVTPEAAERFIDAVKKQL